MPWSRNQSTAREHCVGQDIANTPKYAILCGDDAAQKCTQAPNFQNLREEQIQNQVYLQLALSTRTPQI